MYRGTVEVPECVIPSVRVSVACTQETDECIRVKIGLLVAGTQDGIEHVTRVVQKVFYFHRDNHHLNIDSIIPFEELNPPATNRGNFEISTSAVNNTRKIGVFVYQRLSSFRFA